MEKQERWTLRVPATTKGATFITQLKSYLNKDSYRISTMYTGSRPKGTSPYATRKENATSIRIYIDSKRTEDHPSHSIAYGRRVQRHIDVTQVADVLRQMQAPNESIDGRNDGHSR